MKKSLNFVIIGVLAMASFSCKKQTFDDSGIPIIVAPPTGTTGIISPRVVYVSTTGDDSRSKGQAINPATPWKTIQKAANSIAPGDTVMIFGGTYNEKVTLPISCNGTSTAQTVFRNVPGSPVILDGANGGEVYEGLVNMNGGNFITLKGIKTQNVRWYGFNVGNSNNITIDSCQTFNTGASGIYCVRGTNINITNNNVRRACQQAFREPNGNGTQECISVVTTGNFIISRNEVWDSTIPGAAGGEGIDAKSACFNGEISNNYVHDIMPLGIYLDAGSGIEKNIRVFNNRVINTAGVSVAGELGGHAMDLYFYNNIIRDSKSTGFSFGNTGNGRFSNIYVVNNTFINNATTVNFSGEIANYNTNPLHTNLVIRNNIIYNKGSNYKFSFFTNLLAPFVISNNLYVDFKPGLSGGINNFTTANLTAADVLTDPLFTNLIIGDLTLQAASPAINKGVIINAPSSTTPLFTTDYNGKVRTGVWDMGAFEF